MAESWYVLVNGEQRGPMSAEAVRKALARGELTQDDWAWREGIEDWVHIAAEPTFTKVRRRWNAEKAFLITLGLMLLTAALNYKDLLNSYESASQLGFISETAGRVLGLPIIVWLVVAARNLILLRRI